MNSEHRPSVCVMMSTYNGQAFLSEQIDSILNQKSVNVTLYIRDDGSSDNTISIILGYIKKNPNIVLYKGQNIGVSFSFMKLLYNTPNSYDYYAFSDQDDVWLEDKLIEGIRTLQGNPGKCLYASNQECIDAVGKSLGFRYSIEDSINTESLAVFQKNMLAGCTFVFTRQLKKLLSEPDRRPSKLVLRTRIHDVWVINIAALFNGVIYDPRSHMLYRQHNGNAIGAYTRGLRFEIKQKIIKLFDKTQRNGRSLLGAELYRCFPEQTEENRIFAACVSPGKTENKMVLLKSVGVLKAYTGETTLGLKCKILMGLF